MKFSAFGVSVVTASLLAVSGSALALQPAAVYSAGSPVHSSPTAVDGVVYFGDDASLMHAVTTADGLPVPGFPVFFLGSHPRITSRAAVYVTDPDGPGGAAPVKDIYFTDISYSLSRVSADGSATRWFRVTFNALLGQVYNTPAVTEDGTIYFGFADLDANGAVTDSGILNVPSSMPGSGSSLFLFPGPGVYPSSVAVYGSKIFVGASGAAGNSVYVVDAAGMTALTSSIPAEGVTSPPYVLGQDMFAGTLAGNVYKINSSNGNVDLSFGTPATQGFASIGEPLPSSPFPAGGYLYYGSSKGKVWKVNPADGAFSMFYDTGDANGSITGLSLNPVSNTLGFGTTDGYFYEVPLSGAAADAAGPIGGAFTATTFDRTTNRFYVGNDNGNVYGF